MPHSLYQTTAEEIIATTDAVLQKHDGASIQLISDFLTTSLPNAENAANMSVELGLIRLDTNLYYPLFPYANYIITGNPAQKASVLRFILEEYEPYKLFKNRLKINGISTEAAAAQTKAIFALGAHRTEISNTLISLGTYTNSLKTQGSGKYLPAAGNDYNFLKIFEEVIQDRQSASMKIRERLGEEICQWVNAADVLNPIITAYQRAAEAHIDARSPIVHAGNAIESFLVQVASNYAVNVVGANGLNAKIDRITAAGHLTVKHKNMYKYLGHIRNACDHGIDLDIGTSWSISSETSVEYVHVCLTAIRSTFDCIQGNYII